MVLINARSMKRLILIVMLLLPLGAMAQNEGFASLLKRYSTMQHCTTIELSHDMLESMGIKAGIDKMSIISVEDRELFGDFRKGVDSVVGGKERFMSVNNDGGKVDIYHTKGANGATTEMIIITENDSAFVVVYLTGRDIALNDVESLIKL